MIEPHDEPVDISSRDYWVKVIEMLQQNWALVDDKPSGAVVWFLDDLGGVFDELHFGSADQAAHALRRNGFSRLADEPRLQDFLGGPQPPFRRWPHPNGRIYSSGRYWKS